MTIYFIRAGDSGNIKIGYTAGSAEKRMRQLQTGNIFELELLGTIPGEMCDEKSMHLELQDYSLRGEWFRPEPELLAIVHEMIKGQKPWYYCRKCRSGFGYEKMERQWAKEFGPMVAASDDHVEEICVAADRVEKLKRTIAQMREIASKQKEMPTWALNRINECQRKIDADNPVTRYLAAWREMARETAGLKDIPVAA